MQGKTINGFTLQRLLGVGGMAEVWYAENEIGLGAAVKIISEELSHSAQMQERFRNEAKVMVKLDHPNIRRVYGFGNIDGRPCIVMEYLEGNDLKALLKKGRRFTQEELVKWWNQLVDALSYTHTQNIVHRDIKPSNIFIDQRGNVKLLDFGIAKVIDTSTGTQTGSTLGTRIYMSPEQVRDPKRVGPPSDVYSLAVSFVHLLTGKAPYDSSTNSDYDIQESIVRKPLDMSLVPAEWQSFLKPYLAKELLERATLRHFTVSFDVTSASMPPSDSEKNSLLLEENHLLKEKYRQLELLMAEQKARKENYPMVDSEANVATVSDNMTTGDDLVFTVNDVSFVMKQVEGSTFWMGAHDTYKKTGLFSKEPDSSIPNFDSEANGDEQPVHRVDLKSFYIGETEVTQVLWKAVMGGNPSHFKGDNLPVEKVSWNDCQNFIKKLNEKTGQNFRLPTEAEWEYAARGGKKGNGKKYAGSNNISEVAWHSSNSESKTHFVKGKRANELGLYDMSGNVWEWCSDWYGSYGSGSQTNPAGPSNGSYRVLRGGSWSNLARYCRVSYRGGSGPDGRFSSIGFRLALIQ